MTRRPTVLFCGVFGSSTRRSVTTMHASQLSAIETRPIRHGEATAGDAGTHSLRDCESERRCMANQSRHWPALAMRSRTRVLNPLEAGP